MAMLIAGLLLVLGTHSVRLYANDWRQHMIDRIGEKPWKGLFSVVSLLGLYLLIVGYDGARSTPVTLYDTPLWMRHVTVLLMLFASIFMVAAYVPRNHLKARMGHPMILSVKTWALAHLLSNGTLADVLVFGGFLLWAVLDFIRLRRADRANSTLYPEGGIGNTLLTIALGAILWAVITLWLHARFVGVAPLAL